MIAFAVQGGISVVLATVLAWMTTRTLSTFRVIQDSVVLSLAVSDAMTGLLHYPSSIEITEVVQLVRYLRDSSRNRIENLSVVRQLKSIMSALERGDYKKAIQSWAGMYNWDMVGLKSVPGFIRMLVAQGPRLGSSRAQRLAYLQGMATKSGVSRDFSADVEARIEIVNGILIAVSDAQLVSGMFIYLLEIAKRTVIGLTYCRPWPRNFPSRRGARDSSLPESLSLSHHLRHDQLYSVRRTPHTNPTCR